jgi:hypothetical protein
VTVRSPIGGPGRGDWRLRPQAIEDNFEFIAKCLALWDEGLDTKEIADITFQHESVVETATRIGRERRRTER